MAWPSCRHLLPPSLPQVKKIERGEAEPPPLAIPDGGFEYGDDDEEDVEEKEAAGGAHVQLRGGRGSSGEVAAMPANLFV